MELRGTVKFMWAVSPKNSKYSRLELTAARHNLGTKQAELTFVAEDVFNKSVNADIDNRLAALGARDEIRNVSLDFRSLYDLYLKTLMHCTCSFIVLVSVFLSLSNVHYVNLMYFCRLLFVHKLTIIPLHLFYFNHTIFNFYEVPLTFLSALKLGVTPRI